MEKHNKLVERMYNLKERFDTHEKLYEEKFKVASHRIEDLEWPT